MSDLTDFLLAHIEEREKAARRAARFRYDHPGDSPWESARVAIERGVALSSSEHIALNDPARVLADCEANRRIVDLLSDSLTSVEYAGDGGVYEDDGADRILRHLATVYADHPDYREEWRP